MNIVVADSAFPLRLRPAATVDEAMLLRFSRANRPLRMEREANGEVLIMTPAGAKTGLMNQRVSQALGLWAEEDGRGVAFDSSAGFKLPDGSVRSPDACWMSLVRWNGLTAEQQEGFAPACPEFVVELRSPSDGFAELKRKMAQWLANGAEVGWLIDPVERRVLVYRAGRDPEEHEDPTSVRGSGCVAGFELVMARIWA